MTTQEPKLDLKTIIAIIGVIVAPIIAYYSAQASTAKEISAVSERVKGVEVFVPTIDARLKNIESALKIVPITSTATTIK